MQLLELLPNKQYWRTSPLLEPFSMIGLSNSENITIMIVLVLTISIHYTKIKHEFIKYHQLS